MTSAFEQLCDHARETAKLESIKELIEWDERTNMPPAAGEYRAEQIAYLSRLVHQRKTDTRIRDWLAELADDPIAADVHSDAGTTIRQLRREFDQLTKLPTSLVEELTRLAVLGQQAWVEAREQDDFGRFQPLLENIVQLKQQEAEALGYEESPYDALLDQYEPHAKTSEVAATLEGLREALVPLIAAIRESGQQAPVDILHRNYPIDQQATFGRAAAEAIGFDFTAGRLDITHHPFCTGVGPRDSRITTRYDENFVASALFGTLHEAGHGIYDQGLRTEQYGLPPGSYVSLGIHESQSRMWENFVGRSRAFWQHFFPTAQAAFPDALSGVSLDEFFFAVNGVSPSLIRVEADEATYNLHIIIRFELEQALVSGDLRVADLPQAWNEKYQTYLGIAPPSNADGVLQDIHWSAALFGYFPTYSLGNLYAAQFFDKADQELGGLQSQFAQGEFAPLKQWLNENIHQPGQCYTATELLEKTVGAPLHHDALMQHLQAKLAPLYGLS